jgi:hypothetical protein
MIRNALVPLSDETGDQIASQFGQPEATQVRELLLGLSSVLYHAEVLARVRFDILYLAAGEFERVRELAALARQDPREVMAAEYQRIDGRSVPREWAMRHLMNQRLKERQQS